MASVVRPSSDLRDRRLACGLTQAELAAQARVSRQLVAAAESGQNTPAVDAALRLARALSTTVEDLFALEPAPFIAALGDAPPDGTAVRIGRIGDQVVVAELPDHGVSGPAWARPDGMIEGSGLRLFPAASPAGLVVAGCDPALGVAEATFQGMGPISLLALSASTGVALNALARGSLHAAVVHGPSDDLPTPPIEVSRLHMARWQVGIAHPPRLGHQPLDALLRGDTTLVQRDPAAASQQALNRAATLFGVTVPAGPEATGHIDAARIAAILQSAGLTTESAARAFDLHFIPLETHVVQIWFDRRWAGEPAVQALGNLLCSKAFTDRVTQFGGYDLAGCGNPIEAG